MNVTSELDALFDKIKLFFRSETVVGKPIEVGAITLIPILSLSFGAGNGAAGGEVAKGSGAGAGGKITPIALVTIQENEIKLFSLNGQNNLREITEIMPDIMSSFNSAADETREK